MPALGSKTAEQLALDGVKAFYDDTQAAGLALRVKGASRTAAE
jgi:hypothetical protein